MEIGFRQRIEGDLLDSAYAWRSWVGHLVAPTSPDGMRYGHLAPVLLLPGVYETWQFLEPLGRRLHRLGHPIHVLPDFGFNLRTIPESATLAQAYLNANDVRDVVIVAHSKGGLIAKQMMVADDRTVRISRLVAINTPFQGSSHARWALRRSLREFHPAGPAITSLEREVDANIRITSIFSARDPIIPAGSRLPGATNIDLPVIGHFRILSSPLLWSEVERVLAQPTG